MKFKQTLLPFYVGFICFSWAFIAWLNVIPNGDFFAEAIQIQLLIKNPHFVLAYPGQTHGGVLEYPFLFFAEWLLPGNFLFFIFPRVIMAFFTGFFASKFYLKAFPTAPTWSFILAVVSGPAIMHVIPGPSSNPGMVMWLI